MSLRWISKDEVVIKRAAVEHANEYIRKLENLFLSTKKLLDLLDEKDKLQPTQYYRSQR
jgi:hypothetical protein